MEAMFMETDSFNADISGWDVSSVTDMGGMFRSTAAFDQPIGSWNTLNVENIGFDVLRLRIVQSGHQRLERIERDQHGIVRVQLCLQPGPERLDVSRVTGWLHVLISTGRSATGMSSATNLNQMFRNADSFNQDLSGWCVTGFASPQTSH